MAIDPTAPITPLVPATPAGDAAADPAKALLALARAAAANNASVLGEIAVGGAHANPNPNAVKAGTGATAANLAASLAPDAGGLLHADPSAPAAPTTAERMTMAVRSAAAQAAPRQSGLAPMMANLEAAIARPEIPGPVRQAARTVLDKALPAGQPVTAGALRQALQGSGVFLEARMAQAAAVSDAPVPSRTPPEGAGGDMKAALLVLRAVVSTWLAKAPAVASDTRAVAPGTTPESEAEPARPYVQSPRPGAPPVAPTTSPAGPQDPPAPLGGQAPPRQEVAKAVGAPALPTPPADAEAVEEPPLNALKPPETPANASPAGAIRSAPTPPQQPLLMVGLIEDEAVDLAPSAPADEESALPMARGPGYGAARPQASPRPPPPYAGGPTAAQAAAPSDLPKDLPVTDLARRLLKDVGGALARQELSQIASLPEGRHDLDRVAETKSSRWVFDLPFQTPQGVAVAQFEINKDGGGGADGGRDVERTWRARFSLDVEPLGPVHVQVALTGTMTRVGLWAERPEAMARLRAGEATLSAALRQAELTPEVAFHPGSPVAAPSAPGHFVDRAS